MSQIKKVDCFQGKQDDWVVYGWFVGDSGGFTFGKFEDVNEAKKLLKQVAAKM